MTKNLSNPKRRLSFFLDFINLKIGDRLSNDKLFAIWTDLRTIAYGRFGAPELPDHLLVKWEERRKEAKEIQSVLRLALEKTLSFQPKTPVRRVIRTKTESEPGSDSPYRFNMTVEIKAAEGKRFFPFSNFQEILLWEFFSALKQFPLDLIQKCEREDCGGFFLKSTKERRYCSAKCAWILARRKARKENPEKEREKLRQYYFEKRKREVGPDVVIRKRRRKETESGEREEETIKDAESNELPSGQMPGGARDVEDQEIDDTAKVPIKIPSGEG